MERSLDQHRNLVLFQANNTTGIYGNEPLSETFFSCRGECSAGALYYQSSFSNPILDSRIEPLRIGGKRFVTASDGGFHFTMSVLILQIADREVARKAAVQRNIDYICRQLELLNVVGEFPAADLQAEPVTNRATDVLSSAMNYLAVHIRHEPGSLGVLGILPPFMCLSFQQLTSEKLY